MSIAARLSRAAVCIGCGCDDRHACRGGCWWLRVDYIAELGVCSECEAHVEAWDRGDRAPHAEPVAAREDPVLSRIPTPVRPRPVGVGPCPHDWPFEEVQDADCCRWCGMGFLRHVFTECP